MKSTVSSSISRSISIARGVRRASVLWLTKPFVMNAWSSVSTRRLYTGCTAGVGHRGDPGVVETAVGQVGGDGANIGIRDVRRISARSRCHREIRSTLCLSSHSLSTQRLPLWVRTNVAKPGTWSSSQSPAVAGSGIENPGQLRLLRATETDLRGEQFGLRAVRDYDLVLAVACRYRREITPNSSSICCTSTASCRLRVE